MRHVFLNCPRGGAAICGYLVLLLISVWIMDMKQAREQITKKTKKEIMSSCMLTKDKKEIWKNEVVKESKLDEEPFISRHDCMIMRKCTGIQLALVVFKMAIEPEFVVMCQYH
ncbi:hypothetical protein Ancab_019595 [Ancistrocladus abbreviatus]